MSMDPTFSSVYGQIMALVLGCCLGSFFNVVIYRLPQGLSIVKPGSHCPSCKHPIAFYENVPVLSYIILGGRCRHCGVRISMRYPLVEALTGILSFFLFRMYGWSLVFLFYLVFASLLVIISFIDLDTLTIPDILSLPGLVIGFLTSFFNPQISWVESSVGILLGGGLFYGIAWAYQALRRQEGLGGGDIKLLAMIGAFTGWPGVVFTILFGSLAGAAIGVFVMWKTRAGMAARIPFGPFLALGGISYLFWGNAFFIWYLESMVR